MLTRSHLTIAALLLMALARVSSGGGDSASIPSDAGTEARLPPRPDTEPPAPPAPAPGDNPDLSGALAQVRAIEQWFDWMSLSGSSDHVLLGVAAPADIAAVRLGTRSVPPMAGLAAKLIDRGIEAHDRSPARGEPATEELVSRAIHARTVLLPLRVARLTLLSAALEPAESRARQLRETAGKMAASAEPVSPWADAERSLLIGLAWLGNGGAAEAGEHFTRAAATLAEPGTPQPVRDELGAPLRVAEAMIGGAVGMDALLREQMEKSDPREAELMASALWRVSSRDRSPAEAPSPAFRGYDAAYGALARRVPPVELPAVILNRLGAVVGHDAHAGAPGIVRAASLYQRCRTAVDQDSVRLTVALALELLRTEPSASALAAWVPFSAPEDALRLELARAACELGEAGITPPVLAREAVRRLAALDPATDPALFQRVVSLARANDVPLNTIENGSAIDPAGVLVARSWNAPFDEAERLLGEAVPAHPAPEPVLRGWAHLLDRLLRDPDEVGGDRTRIHRVAERSLAASPPVDARDTSTLLRIDALLALDRLAEAENLAGTARSGTNPIGFLLVQVARRDAAAAAQTLGALASGESASERMPHAVRLLSDRGWALIAGWTRWFADEPATDTVRAGALGLALTMDRLDALNADQQDLARERAAWGLLFAGEAPRAVASFRELVARIGKRADLLRGLGESALSAGDDAAAFGAFRDIASATNPQGEGARDYFHAWARMLEILQRKNSGGERNDSIAREVRRLRLLNPSGACAPCAERIEAIARAVGM